MSFVDYLKIIQDTEIVSKVIQIIIVFRENTSIKFRLSDIV